MLGAARRECGGDSLQVSVTQLTDSLVEGVVISPGMDRFPRGSPGSQLRRDHGHTRELSAQGCRRRGDVGGRPVSLFPGSPESPWLSQSGLAPNCREESVPLPLAHAQGLVWGL